MIRYFQKKEENEQKQRERERNKWERKHIEKIQIYRG